MINRSFLFICAAVFFSGVAAAQVSLSAQLRARAEYRNGQGAPLPEGSDAAAFISQRTRLNASFLSARIKMNVSLQDVRVWGQDVSTINRFTVQDMNGLMLHEAWAEVLLSDTAVKQQSFQLKIGRQELVYDDQRLIGNLDWLQQARRHDAAVLKFMKGAWMLHAGAAFNQNKENQSGTLYSNALPGNYPASTNGGLMYKSMEFFYAVNKTRQHHTSFLFFGDQFSRYSMEEVGNEPTKTFVPGTWSRFTGGVYYSGEFRSWLLSASAYYQFGKNNAGEKVNAQMVTGAAHRKIGKITAGAGIDYTSGGTGNNQSKTFDPLYGTPHKFWGAMDYFYAGSGFGKGGLVDYYARLKYAHSKKVAFTADLHHFTSAARIPDEAARGKRQFGEELDLHASCAISKDIALEGGFSRFFTRSLLTSPSVKNIAHAKGAANWAYVMINIKPEFIFK